MKKLIIPLLIFLVPIYSSSQSRRTPEIRSCLASEFAFASLENANPSKGWDDNFETGKVSYFSKKIFYGFRHQGDFSFEPGDYIRTVNTVFFQ